MCYKIIKSSILTLLIIIGTLLLNFGVKGFESDIFIDKGFSYCPLFIINVLVLVLLGLYELKKSKARLISYIVCLIIFLLSLIGLKDFSYYQYSFRYLYSITLLIMFAYDVYNLIDLGKTIYPNFYEEKIN